MSTTIFRITHTLRNHKTFGVSHYLSIPRTHHHHHHHVKTITSYVLRLLSTMEPPTSSSTSTSTANALTFPSCLLSIARVRCKKDQ